MFWWGYVSGVWKQCRCVGHYIEWQHVLCCEEKKSCHRYSCCHGRSHSGHMGLVNSIVSIFLEMYSLFVDEIYFYSYFLDIQTSILSFFLHGFLHFDCFIYLWQAVCIEIVGVQISASAQGGTVPAVVKAASWTSEFLQRLHCYGALMFVSLINI